MPLIHFAYGAACQSFSFMCFVLVPSHKPKCSPWYFDALPLSHIYLERCLIYCNKYLDMHMGLTF